MKNRFITHTTSESQFDQDVYTGEIMFPQVCLVDGTDKVLYQDENPLDEYILIYDQNKTFSSQENVTLSKFVADSDSILYPYIGQESIVIIDGNVTKSTITEDPVAASGYSRGAKTYGLATRCYEQQRTKRVEYLWTKTGNHSVKIYVKSPYPGYKIYWQISGYISNISSDGVITGLNSMTTIIQTIADKLRQVIYINDVKFELDHTYLSGSPTSYSNRTYIRYFSSDESDNYIKYETDSQRHLDSELMKFSQFNFSKNDAFKCVILYPA